MKLTQYVTANELPFQTREVFPSVNMSGAVTVDITDEVLGQDFEGFGVAITGSSCYLLNAMDPDKRKAFLEKIYGKNGLGLKVGRLSIGASDYSAELYSYDDVEGDTELKHFSIERDERYVIPMIKEILEIAPDLRLFASPWSPPGWMKTGGSMCGGYMREEYIDCYANYIIRFIEEYAKHGIKISAVTPQNETENHQYGRMPACIWHPDIEAKFISVLRRKLDAKGLDVKIYILDHDFGFTPRVEWQLKEYPQLKEDCGGFAFHYYGGAIEQTAVLKNAYPNIPLHFTEAGPRLNDNYGTDWCKWGIMISKVLNCGFSSFTGWNLLLDETGGPNIGPFTCGGLATVNSITGELSYSGQYKALKHIAPFLGRNCKVLRTVINKNDAGMFRYPKLPQPLTCTAIEAENGNIILLLVNPDATKKQVQYYLNGTWWYTELLPDTLSTVVIEKQ